VSFEECTARPEVSAYIEQVRQRMLARWVLPPETPANQRVRLRFRLDPAGSATNVEFVDAPNRGLGESAAQALRSASPFPPMTDRVRCLTDDLLTATFTNPTGTS
jgi:TonB family protein